MMSSTELLRHMLDERGVKWVEFIEHTATAWTDGTQVFTAFDGTPDGKLELCCPCCTPEQAIAATLGSCNCSNSERTSDSDATAERRGDAVEVVRCRDCEHGHITINGKSCKWCDLIATHDIDGNEPNNGYDPEPYFDADFFCAWGKRKESE